MGFLFSESRTFDPSKNAQASAVLDELIGKGMKFPLEFSETQGGVTGVAEISGIQKINSAIYFVLTTRRGEYFMHPAFGSNLMRLLFEPVSPSLLGRIEFEVRETINRFVPQIALGKLQVQQDELDDDMVVVTGFYQIRNTPFKGSFVYPFQTGSGGLS